MGPESTIFSFVYFTLGGCCGTEREIFVISLWEGVAILAFMFVLITGMSNVCSNETCSSSAMYHPLPGCHSFFQCHGYL